MTRSSRLFYCLSSAVLLVIVAAVGHAFERPQTNATRELAFRHPDLYIGNVLLPATGSRGAIPSRALSDLEQLGIAPEAAFLDLRSGHWSSLMPAEPLIPGDGVGNRLQWNQGRQRPTTSGEIKDAAWHAFKAYLGNHRAALGLDMADVVRGKVTVHSGGSLIQIYSPRVHRGITVRNSFISATIGRGNLTLLGLQKWGDITTSPIELVDRSGAVAAASTFLGDLAGTAQWGKSELVYQPTSAAAHRDVVAGDGYRHRLVWALHPSWVDAYAEWEVLVDAHNGEVIAFIDRANYATSREIDGGVFPVSNDGVGVDGTEQVYPMPFADLDGGVGSIVSDTGGNAFCVDGSITTSLKGPYVAITDSCGALSETTAGDLLALGTSAGTDCTTPTGAGSVGNTHAARSGFYEINKMMEIGRSYLPDNTWLQNDLPVTMNINETCNATGGASQLRFYRAGDGCNNTGEIAGVFDHEWGHGMDQADASGFISSPGEGIADIYASLRLDTSCIGRNFRSTVCDGFGDPCLTCTGVRDIDYLKRQSGLPHDLAWIDATCDAFGGGSPCGGSVHCEGSVYAEAVYDLLARDLNTEYGMDALTAKALTMLLTFRGAGAVGSWYSCVNGTGTGDGCNADGGYLNYLAADDDDGDLGNGTPHMTAIAAAFNRHGIGCGTPTITDSGCADTPTTAPTVTASALDRGARLSWPAVANATAYRVYRGEGVSSCGFGKVLLAETTNLFFNDSGLHNGFNYSYVVVPIGAGSECLGPASSCAAVTPAVGGVLVVDTANATVSITTGDSDAFIDNCEVVEVTFDLLNAGSSSQTNVRVASATSPSHPGVDVTVTFPSPIAAALPACGTAQGTFSFTGVGLAHNDTLQIELTITSDELVLAGQTRTALLVLNGTESDFQDVSSLTFNFESDFGDWSNTSGTFARTDHSTGGAGDSTDFSVDSSNALDNICDRARSPAFKVSATTTLDLWNNYDIEPLSASTWYDRANVAIIAADGNRTVATPDSGRLYNATSGGPGNYTGCNEPEPGWADTASTWATSSFSAAGMGSVALDGQLAQLEVTYATDAGQANRGFWFDEVTLTDVAILVPDVQDNVCVLEDLPFLDGFESGDTSAWSSAVP